MERLTKQTFLKTISERLEQENNRGDGDEHNQ
jgi:hypothetical protein